MAARLMRTLRFAVVGYGTARRSRSSPSKKFIRVSACDELGRPHIRWEGFIVQGSLGLAENNDVLTGQSRDESFEGEAFRL